MSASSVVPHSKGLTVVTDAPDYAGSLLQGAFNSTGCAEFVAAASEYPTPPAACASVADAFFPNPPTTLRCDIDLQTWRYLVVSGFSSASQYDRLIRLAREPAQLPDGLACVARTGRGFQGFHGRSWVGAPGNLHLSVHLAPGRRIERFETVFMALAAVSVVEAIDAMPGLRGAAGIRWVNDIVIDDAKVAGVLAYSQTRGDQVTSVILGIGLNVETRPLVPATAFVPKVASLRQLAGGSARVDAGLAFRELLAALARNYRTLLTRGWGPLMEDYRDRSVVLGRHVAISSDDPDEVPRVHTRGRVVSISDGMELFVEGADAPIRRGRLILPLASQRVPEDGAPTANLGMAS